jgi:hypothetical protein
MYKCSPNLTKNATEIGQKAHQITATGKQQQNAGEQMIFDFWRN